MLWRIVVEEFTRQTGNLRKGFPKSTTPSDNQIPKEKMDGS